MTTVKDTVTDGDTLGDIAGVCGVPLTAIEDLYPCTALQVGIMAQPIERIYINCVYATLSPTVDADGFCRALCHVYLMNPVLRTRIVDCEFGLVQVVLKEVLSIARPSQRLEEVLECEKAAPMRLGTPLFRAALLGRKLILTTHHAISDGGTYHRLFDDLSRVYHGQSLVPHANFKLFVKHCLSIDENMAKAFWGARFSGHPTIFPKIDVEHIPDASKKLETQISFGPWGLSAPLGLMSSYIETAWAITVKTYTNAENIVFGRVLSARVSGLGGLESTSGPTIVTMPVQVNVNKDATIAGLIKERAQERREALKTPSLQYGLIRIRDVNDAAKVASKFTTLLNFRTPTGDGRDYESAELEIHGEYEAHLPYGLGLSIVLTGSGLSVETLYDEKVVCERQTRRILRQFEHILTLLLQSPAGTRLDKLQLLNPHDRRELLGWNMELPDSPRQSLHNMFRGIAQAQPDVEAVEGPDGRMTYAQLNELTDSIAFDLGERGVSAEDAIALVFDKSTWAVVAQLSVLKAGAVCVPIDPGFPFARKETIISNSGAKMILTSVSHVESLGGHKRPVVVIDAQQTASQSTADHGQRPGLEDTPAQAAFILFTSGSTGTPKGHILEHRNLASSLVAIGREMKWGPGVRMLQFAAYVWDMSIAEIFGTLVSGGCVCIPSEEARESYIEGFIQSQRVNCAIFTPTVLRMITPQGASSLKTIMSIGEPVDLESVNMWSGHARFFNAWGPSETACVSSMAELTADSPFQESIGRPLASAIWLVDEKNIDTLVPVGGVGEIVVESNGVARGYLNDQRQTAASFISPPRWAPPRKAQGSTEPQRMYRTGDLARHNPDGSLEYIGRLDNQVKIHGQRVELGEVEKSLSACAGVRHAMVVIQSSREGHRSKDLIAVVTLEEPQLSSRQPLKELPAELQPDMERSLESIREALASRLPTYMVPTTWKVVEDFPRTASWKIDRASIKKWLTQWAPERVRIADVDALTPPASPVEGCLQATWALALCISENEIGRESSFIKLGGDSILAIKVATQCRKRGVRVSVATLLRSENLANVAAASEFLPNHSHELTLNGDQVDGDAGNLPVVPLSPFQQLLVHDGINSLAVTKTSTYRHCLQSWNPHTTPKMVQNALLKLADHHAMLRARLVQQGKRWTYMLITASEARQCIRVYSSETPVQNGHSMATDPKSQPFSHEFLLEAELKSSNEGQKDEQPVIILLTSSFLFDKSSWVNICRDLESLLVDPNRVLPPTPSFARWIQAQANQAPNKNKPSSELRRAPTGYWGLHEPASYDNTVIQHEALIDAELVDSIFGPCNRAFNTTPAELLVTAVLFSFAEGFPDRGGPALYVQHDGRREIDITSMDFSRTAGNFTTLVPIFTSIGTSSSPEDAVRDVKDSYRSLLQAKTVMLASGSRTLASGPLSQSDVEILFHLEDMQEEETWQVHNLNESLVGSLQHLGLIKISAQRLGKQLRLCVGHDRRMAHQDRLSSWVTTFQTSLSNLAGQLACCSPRLTFSEAPLLHLDTGDLREIQTHLGVIGIGTSNVEAVLPCSPLQEGILLSQLKNPRDKYWMRLTMKLTPITRGTDEVDIDQIKKAWKAVCSAQPILRTIFVGYETSTSAFQQVILRSTCTSISEAATTDSQQANIESTLDDLAPPSFAASQPPHHLHLARASPVLVYATLHINHALFDERSMQLVGQQIGQAYTDAASLHRGPSLAEYLAWTEQHKEAARDYWRAHLLGVEPCLVPVLESNEARLLEKGSDICDVPIEEARRPSAFCRKQGITVPNLMQVAWSMVLRLCTGSKSLCFGYLHSNVGAFEGAEVTLGPILSMAFHRFEVVPERTIAEVLRESNDNLSRGLDQGACSLSEIMEAIEVGHSPLFNTIMTIYRLWPNDLAGAGDIRVEHMPLGGHTEYVMTLGIGYNNDNIVSKLLYDTSKISHSFASQVAKLFVTVVTRIVSNPRQSMETLEASVEHLKPVSVSAGQDISKATYRRAAAQCEISVSKIEDIYPCTSWQRQQMETAVQENRRGLNQYVFRIGEQTSSITIQEAWERVAAACPAVRTRLASLREYGVCQVTLKNSPGLYCADEDSLSEYLKWDQELLIRYGRPLCRFAKVEEPDGTIFFVLSVHSTICDPWTLTLILKALAEARKGAILAPLMSFGGFMRLLSNRTMRSASDDRPIVSRHDAVLFPAVQTLAETQDAAFCMSGSLDLGMAVGTDVLYAAWSLCLSRITGDENICFGVYLDGRNRSAEAALSAQVVGSFGAVVPLTIDLATTPTTESLLQMARAFADRYKSHTQDGGEIPAMSQDKDTGCSFRNVLIVDNSPAVLGHTQPQAFELTQTQMSRSSFGDNRLIVICRVMSDKTTVEMHYDEHVITGERVAILMEQYRHTIEQILSCVSTSLANLPALSSHELALLQACNREMPVAEDVCVHDQIRATAKLQPTGPAICSWDHELDRKELDNLSDRVAAMLRREGIGSGTIVPYFLEKSATAVIVMLGILKAGGSLLPLDIKHPAHRIEIILSEASTSRIVTSSTLLNTVSGKVKTQDAVVVDMQLIQSLPPGPLDQVEVKPSDLCYIIYTSGSTGKPKGIMVTHSNFSTSIKYRRDLLGMGTDTRTLQYLNFIFDVSMFDIFLTLLSGGCVCLPSEDEWSNDIAGAIRRTGANFAFLTPSLAALLDPRDVPSLRTLGLTGEPFEKQVIEKWRHVRVLNMYGPAEATVHSSGCDVSIDSGKHHLNIGRAGGCLYWVTDVADHNRLVPIGCPGELLIQGPIVSLGYLGNPDKTEAAFIDPPSWVQSFGPVGSSRSQRWYKTGDIVVETADGSMIYQGRKDTQVKVSGQRIELGEIEYHLSRSLKTCWEIAVELIKPAGRQDSDPCLVVFFAVVTPTPSETCTTGMPCELLPPLAGDPLTLRHALTVSLPAYMVPHFFIRLTRLPLTSSGKTDRASLRRIGATLSPRQLSSYDPYQQIADNGSLERVLAAKPNINDRRDEKRGGLETELQKLWSETLGLPLHTIHPTDDFFNIGGSSIRAMRLSHAARRVGIQLSTTDVFQSPIFSDMAVRVSRHGASLPSVLDGNSEKSKELTTKLTKDGAFMSSCFAHAEIRHEPYLLGDNIESIAPVTDVQADMVAVGELDGEGWHNEMLIMSSTGLDMADMIRACKAVISHHQILRTVFVQHGSTLYQVAVKTAPLETMITIGEETSGMENHHDDTLDTYLPRFHLGELSHDRTGSRCHMVGLKIHHALYDAIAMDMVLRDLRQAYTRQPLRKQPSFHEWVSHVKSVDPSASMAFWKNALEGASMTYLTDPLSSVPATQNFCRDSMQIRVPLSNVMAFKYGTPSSVVQAVWALVLARATGSEDVVFCAPNANRSFSSFPDMDRLCGLCLNFLPVRARLQQGHQMTLGALIRQMQAQAVAAIPHQHQGFRSILRDCTDWPSWTRYSSVLIYQNHESLERTIRFGDQDCVLTPRGKFGRCADILIEATPSAPLGDEETRVEGGADLVIDILYSRSTFTEAQANWISRTLGEILGAIPQNLEQPINRESAQPNPAYMMTSPVWTELAYPSESSADMGQQEQAVVQRAWAEVGMKKVADTSQTQHEHRDCSMFDCGADLVTTMLLARYYQYKGHQVTMQDLIDNPTLSSQSNLIRSARTNDRTA